MAERAEMNIEAPKFGTSGLRGLADALSDEFVGRYASAFVATFEHGGIILVGRDLRASSPPISKAVIAAIAGSGVRALDCGVLPTPALALAAAKRDASAIMVTGSHIPADRNGLKFYTRAGEFTKDNEKRLSADVAAQNEVALGDAKSIATEAPRDEYIARYVDFFGSEALTGLRIGVWEHSSAARDVMHAVFAGLGADTIPIERSDTFVSVDTEAIGGAVRDDLARWAEQHELDAIVSTDGDGDRPLLADARGEVVPGDILGPLTARALGADAIVTTVSANTNVDLMGAFQTIRRCKIGSPFVIAGMEDLISSRVAGYEPNGGFLLGFTARRGSETLAPLMTRDSLLPMVTVLAAARETGVSALVDGLPSRRTATDRLQDVPREISAEIVAEICAGDMAVVPELFGELENLDLTDGARMTFSNGRILTIRPSGNAPELRCYVEDDTDETARIALVAALDALRLAVSTRR